MNIYYSNLSPKGRMTLPQKVREILMVQPNEEIAIVVEGNDVRLESMASLLKTIAGSVPALNPPRSLDEIMEIAKEEHAREVAREGMEESDIT